MATTLPTIRDVAARAHVSICTVSTILNRQDRRSLYTEATQARVQAAADALGYVPSHRGRALQARRSQAIGVVAPTMCEPFTAATIAAIDRAIRARRLHTVLIGGDGAPHAEDGLAALSAGRVDALVALPAAMRASDHARLESCGNRAVLLLPHQPSPLPRVLVDPRSGIAEAVAHLAQLGHRRIAWLGPGGEVVEAEARLRAVHAAADGLGLACARWAMAEAPRPTEAWIAAARAAAIAGAGAEPATAVLCYNDLCAIGAYGAAAELGLRVGRDLSVVGYDDTHGSISSPTLSSISHMLDAAAEAALELLLDDPQPECGVVRTLPSRLVVRASTAPAPAR